MTIRLSTGLRNLLASSAGFSGAFANGVIYIYSGTQPTTPDAAATGTLLGVVTANGLPFAFGATTNGLNFDAPIGGVVSKNAAVPWCYTGLASGTAGWFRLMGNASDNLGASTTLSRMDGSLSTTGADLNMSNTSLAVGTPGTIDVFQFTIPGQ